ncbi:MAG: GTP 3',8-cyclase MoaA [Proteobacteria bacterium]|nr:GTP 3',8-cyclase MoaA [Pseudomonadota bacterium]
MLQDTQGRQFPYLRLSVTDACNFRCGYCLPNGYQKPSACAPFLKEAEILNLVAAFVALGCQKVRLTGGEPTLRRDIVRLIRSIAHYPGIQTVALSSNGYRLKSLAKDLLEAGLSRLNVSVDTLDPKRFAAYTGLDMLGTVLDGIDEALALGFKTVKINSVLMKASYLDDLELFLDWIRDRPVSVRWIELMPTGGNQDFFQKNFISSSKLHVELLDRGWQPLVRDVDGGPAQEFEHPDYRGRLGLIAPYAKNFCQSCNRLRVTSRGGLRLCLFGDGEQDLRPLLQDPEQQPDLIAAIIRAVRTKADSHVLQTGYYGSNQSFSSMGG